MVKEQLTDIIIAALQAARESGELAGLSEIPTPALEAPKSREHGDYATNVAMVLAKPLGKPPRLVAEAVVKYLPQQDLIKSTEIAGPGFINFKLNHDWLQDLLRRIEREGDDYGKETAAEPLKKRRGRAPH